MISDSDFILRKVAMKDRLLLYAPYLLVIFGTMFYLESTSSDRALQSGVVPPVSRGTEDDPNAQAEMEFMMLRDPATGRIPDNIVRHEQRFARGLPKREEPVLLMKGNSQTTTAVATT
jgi:hypothetical protein